MGDFDIAAKYGEWYCTSWVRRARAGGRDPVPPCGRCTLVLVRQYWELLDLVPDSARQMSVQRWERGLGSPCCAQTSGQPHPVSPWHGEKGASVSLAVKGYISCPRL